MSRLYDTVEPSVIDDKMLKTCIEEQGPKDEAGNIAKKDGILYEEVLSLRLDFQNILRVENLWQFEKLIKLQLDNNVIEKIEGLENLKNLEWLDLSFNNIEKIEGLENLTKLKDLSLFNNQISKLENMNTLENLEVFSIGNNQINDYDFALYLRQFKELKTLCLKGNPICEKPEFSPYVLAHLTQIIYLDYRLVDQNMRAEGLKRFEIDIGQIISNEEADEKIRQENQTLEKETHLNKEAYVEGLNSDELFLSLFNEDSEGQKLNLIPGADDLLADYHDKFVSVCKEMYEYGKAQKDLRENEVGEFWKCLNEAKGVNTEEASAAINVFIEYKKNITEELNNITDQVVQEAKLNEYNDEVNKLWDKLMSLEVQVVDQLEEIIREFERNLSDMVNNFVEQIQGFFGQLRDLENIQFEKLQESCLSTLERVIKGEVSDDFPDDLRDLFIDKDTVVNALQTSHDLHTLKIDSREDDMISKIKNWSNTMIEQIHDEEEYKRNRKRVIEINRLIDYFRDEIYEPADLQD
ncbi:leucine-rich repeat-containing 48 isoform X1 [Brachionus plicatilis]|uniref:Dynein regulatory complex subunit 3 n=1 Tax=Brachionus plicatilis TaxID=10195 RepID=A0A3M7T3F2_BRAPC|nr:leucine-rich repeat-containing 48 isoform X1 [Brachionus plicatilis]